MVGMNEGEKGILTHYLCCVLDESVALVPLVRSVLYCYTSSLLFSVTSYVDVNSLSLCLWRQDHVVCCVLTHDLCCLFGVSAETG